MRKSKYDSQVSQIISKNGPCILRHELASLINELKNGSDSSRYEWGSEERGIFKRLETVYGYQFEGKTNNSFKYSVVSTLENPSILEIGYAFSGPRRYLSHNSAIYFHGLTNQKPAEICISNFSKGRGSIHSGKYDPDLAKMLFSKPSRSKGSEVVYPQGKIKIISKNDRGTDFIEKIDPEIGSSFKVNVESIEMTLIDSAVNPELSGGIFSVIEAYSKASIQFEALIDCYKLNKFFYPYWQTIGFYLEKSNKIEMSNKWEKYFGPEKEEFFLLHGYRSDWILDPKWKLWSPKF